MKSLKTLQIIGLLFTSRNVAFFLISSMVSDRLVVVSDRINRSDTIRAIAIDISKAYSRVSCTDLLHKLKSYGTHIFMHLITCLRT